MPWRRDLTRLLLGYIHSKVIGEKAHVSKMDAIPTDSHLDARRDIS